MTTNKKITIFAAAFGALLLLSIAAGFVIYGVYYKINDSGFTRIVARTFALPAAKVGSGSVSYAQFLSTRDAIEKFINSEAGKQVQAAMPPIDVLNNNVMDRLIRQEMVKEIAAKQKITVSDDEVMSTFSDVVKAAASSTQPDVSKYLQDNYGWSEDNFRQQVLKPALLEQKLATEMAKAKNGDEQAMESELTLMRQNDVVVYLKF